MNKKKFDRYSFGCFYFSSLTLLYEMSYVSEGEGIKDLEDTLSRKQFVQSQKYCHPAYISDECEFMNTHVWLLLYLFGFKFICANLIPSLSLIYGVSCKSERVEK